MHQDTVVRVAPCLDRALELLGQWDKSSKIPSFQAPTSCPPTTSKSLRVLIGTCIAEMKYVGQHHRLHFGEEICIPRPQ
jgi:hypothetical protein